MDPPTNTDPTNRMMSDDAATATRQRWIVGVIVILAAIGLFYWGSRGNSGPETDPNPPAAKAPATTGTVPAQPVKGSSQYP